MKYLNIKTHKKYKKHIKSIKKLFTLVVTNTLCVSLISTQILFTTLLTVQSAHAAGMESIDYIVPDGSTNTTTDRAQNGTPVINIANPNANGMSHNRFDDYNVTNENLILNNFKGDVGVSQLGGALYGNPNFNAAGGRTATLILNEVTSNRVTRLEGYTEIFGDRADLIIANPNGLIVSGAGFINTSRLGLVTGRPNVDSSTGELIDFDLTINPTAEILIEARNVSGTDTEGNTILIPLGIDASTTDYVDIISRVVKVRGDIYAGGELNIKTGNKSYNYTTKQITSKTAEEETESDIETRPELAIDSTAFGGMYAGRINFVATEEGVGVKTVGELVSDVDDINIEAEGDIEYDIATAETNINITSNKGTIKQNFLSYSKGNTTLIAESNITNTESSSILSEGMIDITSNNGDLINYNANIASLGNLTITANNVNNELGNIEAGTEESIDSP
ncbi:filamentous hemagglutinin N-terminal domain-containing protein, partial [Pseudomonadota bacterium]